MHANTNVEKPENNRFTITVYCSARDIATKYKQAAEEFSKLMVKHGYDLVWGGSDVGVMKLVAQTVQEEGGKIFGVTMEILKDSRRRGADEMEVIQTLDQRKERLLERGDAIVLMPGGWGSLDEIGHALELKKHNTHNKPVVALNTDGFWNGLKLQVERFEAEGFSPKPVEEMMFFADTPKSAIDYINGVLKE